MEIKVSHFLLIIYDATFLNNHYKDVLELNAIPAD